MHLSSVAANTGHCVKGLSNSGHRIEEKLPVCQGHLSALALLKKQLDYRGLQTKHNPTNTFHQSIGHSNISSSLYQ